MAAQRLRPAGAVGLERRLLEALAKLVGIVYPPNALFLVAFGFVLVLLLHFSLAVSRLSDQTKLLAQRLAILEQRQSKVEQTELRSDGEQELEGVGSGARRGRFTSSLTGATCSRKLSIGPAQPLLERHLGLEAHQLPRPLTSR